MLSILLSMFCTTAFLKSIARVLPLTAIKADASPATRVKYAERLYLYGKIQVRETIILTYFTQCALLPKLLIDSFLM